MNNSYIYWHFITLNENQLRTDHRQRQISWKKFRFRRFRIREKMWWKLFIGQNEREEIDNETRSKIALSTIAVALNNTNCSVPCFVQVMDRYKDIFNGFSVGGGLRTNYEMIVLKVSWFQNVFLMSQIFQKTNKKNYQISGQESKKWSNVKVSYIYNWCQDLSFRKKLRPCKSC